MVFDKKSERSRSPWRGRGGSGVADDLEVAVTVATDLAICVQAFRMPPNTATCVLHSVT